MDQQREFGKIPNSFCVIECEEQLPWSTCICIVLYSIVFCIFYWQMNNSWYTNTKHRKSKLHGCVRYVGWIVSKNRLTFFSKILQCSFREVTTVADLSWTKKYKRRVLTEQLLELFLLALPKTVEFIGMNAFRYCHNLSEIIIHSQKCVLFGANAFYSTSENKIFKVGKGLKRQYQEVRIWHEYLSSIIENN